MKKLIFTSLFIFAAFTLYAQTVPLTLNIENIGSNKGSIVVNICTIDKGRYGIMVYHDENSNNILDMAMFGKPKERYGFSNNKYGAFSSKPPFEKALMNIDRPTTASIKLKK